MSIQALSPDLIAVAAKTRPSASPGWSADNPGVCPDCLTVVPTTTRHDKPSYDNEYGVRVRAYLMVMHGPRDNRCPGSRKPPLRWIEAAELPLWVDMSDLDRGAALLFLWKCKWERSYSYARDHYPCRYIDDPCLTALDEREACRHAGIVAKTYDKACEAHGDDEVQRLYDLALNHERSAR